MLMLRSFTISQRNKSSSSNNTTTHKSYHHLTPRDSDSMNTPHAIWGDENTNSVFFYHSFGSGFLYRKPYAYTDPYNPNNWYPYPEFSFPSLVIHRPLHTQPDTKNSSKDGKYPEGFFTNSPPLIDRLELVDDHRQIGEETRYGDIDEEVFCHYILLWYWFRSMELLYFSTSYPPILTISISGNSSLIFDSGTLWS